MRRWLTPNAAPAGKAAGQRAGTPVSRILRRTPVIEWSSTPRVRVRKPIQETDLPSGFRSLPSCRLPGFKRAGDLLVKLKQERYPVAVAGEFPLGISHVHRCIQLVVGLGQRLPAWSRGRKGRQGKHRETAPAHPEPLARRPQWPVSACRSGSAAKGNCCKQCVLEYDNRFSDVRTVARIHAMCIEDDQNAKVVKRCAREPSEQHCWQSSAGWHKANRDISTAVLMIL